MNVAALVFFKHLQGTALAASLVCHFDL